MENMVLKDIISYATRKLNASYGYCGIAEGPTDAILNSDDGKGNNIKITIKAEAE